jgi:haloalkane dehalogenase
MKASNIESYSVLLRTNFHKESFRMLESFKDLYPFQSNFFEVDGHKIHYLDEGQGEPIVMLHGNPTWSFFYRNFIPTLSQKSRAVAPDHLGCGLSDKPATYCYTLENHIRNLEKLLGHLKLEKITLVMHDWGGAIGMGYAVRHPENIKRLVILNTAAFRGPKGYTFPWRIRICRIPIIGPVGVRGLNLFVKLAIPMAVMHKQRLTPQIKAGYFAPYNSYANRIAVLEFVRDIPLSSGERSYQTIAEIEDNLGKFKNTPILIAWAGKDFVLNHAILRRWQEIFPHAEVEVYPDAGHYIQEDAYERVVPRIQQFLEKYPTLIAS